MKKIYFLFLIFSLFSQAQNIKGSVFSQKNNNPIEGVNITMLNKNISSFTNESGNFSTKLTSSSMNDTLQFSHIGYYTEKISLFDLKKQNFTILLREEIETLDGLTITDNEKIKLKSKVTYNKLARLKNPVFSFGSLVKDDKVYVAGGDSSFESDAYQRAKEKTITADSEEFMKFYYNELRRQRSSHSYKGDFLIYDIKYDKWQTSEIKFKKRAYNHLHYYNNMMYVLGGKRISETAKREYLENQIEVFDLNKNTITIDNTNPHQAVNFSSFTYKDNIIVMGGSIKSTEKGQKVFTDKVHFYNITSGLWYELSNMPTAKETNGVLIGDKIYLIGGNDGNPLSVIESFDLISEKWQIEGDLFSETENPALTHHNNIVYIFEDRKIYTYDIISKQLKEFVIELELKSSAIHYHDNKLYIIGGYTYNEYSTTPSANTYSISIEEFETTKPNRIKTLQATIATTEIPKP